MGRFGVGFWEFVFLGVKKFFFEKEKAGSVWDEGGKLIV